MLPCLKSVNMKLIYPHIYFVFLVVCHDEEGQVLVLKDVWKVTLTYNTK